MRKKIIGLFYVVASGLILVHLASRVVIVNSYMQSGEPRYIFQLEEQQQEKAIGGVKLEYKMWAENYTENYSENYSNESGL